MPALEASAPGKLVLAGEYAVLAGAPSLVAAVDRFAIARLAPPVSRDAAAWHFQGLGFAVSSRHTLESILDASVPLDPNDPARYVRALTPNAIDPGRLPENLDVTLDTRGFFDASTAASGAASPPVKLGIGSSAAVLVAFAQALAAWTALDAVGLDTLHAAHHALQGGVGSGVDIAAAYHGGVLRFQDGTANRVEMAPEVHFSFVFTGTSTSTADMILRVDAWRQKEQP